MSISIGWFEADAPPPEQEPEQEPEAKRELLTKCCVCGRDLAFSAPGPGYTCTREDCFTPERRKAADRARARRAGIADCETEEFEWAG